MCIKPEKYLIRVTAKNKIWKKDDQKAVKKHFSGNYVQSWRKFPGLVQKCKDFSRENGIQGLFKDTQKVKIVRTLFLSDQTSFSVQYQFYEGTWHKINWPPLATLNLLDKSITLLRK